MTGPRPEPGQPDPPHRVLVSRPRARTVPATPPAARVGIEEETPLGELFITSLIRAQLTLALRLVALFGFLIGGIPLLFAAWPAARAVRVLGLPLPWLLLGIAVYPLLVVGGYLYVRLAERNEQDFLDTVEGS